MNRASPGAAGPQLMLPPMTARELMTPNPVSLPQDITVREAVDVLTARSISGAPVIDEAGRPVGVLSRADILAHDRNLGDAAAPPAAASGTADEPPRVRDLMTPVLFCVSPEAPASRVVREMLDLKVHRLFVVENPGTVVGVITVLDVLRRLTP